MREMKGKEKEQRRRTRERGALLRATSAIETRLRLNGQQVISSTFYRLSYSDSRLTLLPRLHYKCGIGKVDEYMTHGLKSALVLSPDVVVSDFGILGVRDAKDGHHDRRELVSPLFLSKPAGRFARLRGRAKSARQRK